MAAAIVAVLLVAIVVLLRWIVRALRSLFQVAVGSTRRPTVVGSRNAGG